MFKHFQILLILLLLSLCGCDRFSDSTPSPKVKVIDHPPVDWAISGKRLAESGCSGVLKEDCAELIALGCDEIAAPHFYSGGLNPPYPIGECIHQGDEPPDPAYFRRPPGLDSRFRSFVVFLKDEYRLIIKQSEFREIFVPVESAEEALSYAMGMTSFWAEYSIDPNANVKYLVDVIEETYVEETPAGYVVHLFDSDRRMGCVTDTIYAVDVLVTPEGEIEVINREAVFTRDACYDFGVLVLDQD